MEPTTLLYLRLKLAHREDYIDSQLRKVGFKLTKKTGTGLESFRNYYYEMTESPKALSISFKLMPGKNTTQIVELTLSPTIKPEEVEKLFHSIKNLNKSIPLNLLDLKIRNKIYEDLHQKGIVDAYYVGLDKAEQLKVEQQAYIPIDHTLFLGSQHKKQDDLPGTETEYVHGERAPDLDR